MDTLILSQDNEKEVIARAVEVLRQGGVIVYPTDTVFGLGVDIQNEDAVRRLFAFKKRSARKPTPVLVGDIEMARTYAFIDSKQERILQAIWPGAVTAVLWKKRTVPAQVAAKGQTVGLRVPDSVFCLRLLKTFGRAISGTSANISGEQPSSVLAPIVEQFREHARYPDLIIDPASLEVNAEIRPAAVKDTQPSTVIDLTGERVKVLRVGLSSAKQLQELLEVH